MPYLILCLLATLETSLGIRFLISKKIEQFLGSLGVNLTLATKPPLQVESARLAYVSKYDSCAVSTSSCTDS